MKIGQPLNKRGRVPLHVYTYVLVSIHTQLHALMPEFKRSPRSKKYQYNVKITGEMRARLTRMKYDIGKPKADMIRKWIDIGLDELEKKRDLEPITDDEIEYWMDQK